jgi:methylglyoxal synthase
MYVSIILLFCDPGGGRTHDPQIKSLLLYQLSYEVIFFVNAKVMKKFFTNAINLKNNAN